MSTFLETKRLTLKIPDPSHFAELLALRTDPEVMKYIGKNGAIQTKEDVEQFLTLAMSYQAKHGFGFCSVFEKKSGALVGQAGLCHPALDDSQTEIELAYRLHKRYWGKGYATELARALITWGFENLSVDKLVAVTHPDNIASQKVLKKIGMIHIGKRDYRGDNVEGYEIYKNDSIELLPYRPEWVGMAKTEIQMLYQILPKSEILDIQHVGSTAIPNIQAKPIIDIQIAVSSLAVIRPIAIEHLTNHAYVYWYDNPDIERMFFVKGMPPFGTKRTHHVHIVEPTSKHWQGKLRFRDYLQLHPEVAKEYEALKIALAKQYAYDREGYTDAKAVFINDILNKIK